MAPHSHDPTPPKAGGLLGRLFGMSPPAPAKEDKEEILPDWDTTPPGPPPQGLPAESEEELVELTAVADGEVPPLAQVVEDQGDPYPEVPLPPPQLCPVCQAPRRPQGAFCDD